jgi:hypothetical protein
VTIAIGRVAAVLILRAVAAALRAITRIADRRRGSHQCTRNRNLLVPPDPCAPEAEARRQFIAQIDRGGTLH